MENFLTTRQVQKLFKVDRITVYRMLNDGRLKGVKIGKQWRFSQGEVERLLNGISISDNDRDTSVFPVHCVQTIQNLYASVSKANALVVDSAGERVTEISRQSKFCALVQSSPSGMQACHASWRAFARQSAQNGRLFTCHCGLQYCGLPLKDESGVQGFFLSGQFSGAEENAPLASDHCRQLAERHQLDAVALQDALQEIPVYSAAQIEERIEQAQAAAQAVTSILVERNAFIGRLRQIANLTQNL